MVRLPDRIFLRGYPVIEWEPAGGDGRGQRSGDSCGYPDVLRPKVLENFYIDGNP